MPTRRGDKWEGRLKLAGRVVKTRRFDTKRAASSGSAGSAARSMSMATTRAAGRSRPRTCWRPGWSSARCG